MAMLSGKTISDLDTPAVVVDLDRAEANIAKLQSYLDEHRIANRPHVKTHKLPLLAQRQMAAGAVGITVQTLGEAEVMANAGLTDILVTYNLIGRAKAERLAALATRVKIRVAIDNEVALRTVADAAERAGKTIGVLIEFESGKKRQGVLEPAQALALARQIEATDNLHFEGLLTYPASPAVGRFVDEAIRLFDGAGSRGLQEADRERLRTGGVDLRFYNPLNLWGGDAPPVDPSDARPSTRTWDDVERLAGEPDAGGKAARSTRHAARLALDLRKTLEARVAQTTASERHRFVLRALTAPAEDFWAMLQRCAADQSADTERP